MLAPISTKLTIGRGNTTVANPFSALGRECYARMPTFVLALEIGESILPGTSNDDGGPALARTFFVECGSATVLRGCSLSPLGRGRSFFPSAQQNEQDMEWEPSFSVGADGSVVVMTGVVWPSEGVPAALTMTPLAQGAGTHDTHSPVND